MGVVTTLRRTRSDRAAGKQSSKHKSVREMGRLTCDTHAQAHAHMGDTHAHSARTHGSSMTRTHPSTSTHKRTHTRKACTHTAHAHSARTHKCTHTWKFHDTHTAHAHMEDTNAHSTRTHGRHARTQRMHTWETRTHTAHAHMGDTHAHSARTHKRTHTSEHAHMEDTHSRTCTHAPPSVVLVTPCSSGFFLARVRMDHLYCMNGSC